MDQTRELFESPAPAECLPSDAGNGTSDGRELLEWEFDGYVSRAGESWVDPLEFLIDDPTFGFGKPLLPLSLVDDRRHGRNRPIFQTEAQLAMIRGAARIVAQTAPMAIGALEALGNYVIGKGFTYEVADRPFRAGRQAPDGLATCVQDVIDEFCDVNDWVGDRERELHNRVRRDGEAFAALYPGKNGIARTRFIEPERVTEPGNATDFEDWLVAEVPLDWVFGVVTHESDIETVVGYHVLWNPEGTDFDFLPNDDLELALQLGSGLMEHIKVNTDRNVKRGLPDMWAVLTDLVGENELRDVARERTTQLQTQLQTMSQQVAAAQQQKALAEQQVKVEQDRLISQKANMSMLTQGQQSTAANILKKFNETKHLSREDALTLQKLGITQGAIGKQINATLAQGLDPELAKQFKEAGGEEELDKAQQRLTESTTDLADAQSQAKETLQEFREALGQLKDAAATAASAEDAVESTRAKMGGYKDPTNGRGERGIIDHTETQEQHRIENAGKEFVGAIREIGDSFVSSLQAATAEARATAQRINQAQK